MRDYERKAGASWGFHLQGGWLAQGVLARSAEYVYCIYRRIKWQGRAVTRVLLISWTLLICVFHSEAIPLKLADIQLLEGRKGHNAHGP